MVPANVRAQSARPQRVHAIGFADSVPPSTGLFIGARKLAELDAALDRARAWQFLILLSGGSAERAPSVKLPSALGGLLGLHGTADPAAMAECEAGIALSHSLDLASAVWLLRPAKSALFDEWFPPAGRIDATSNGGVSHFRLKTGMKVAISGRIAALSRRWGAESLFAQTLEVLSGSGESLARSPAFRNLATYIPQDYLAVTYLSGAEDAEASAGGALSWWPGARRAIIALFERDGRLDVAVRAGMREPRSTRKLGRAAVDRLLRLPETTLVAAATTVDVARMAGPRRPGSPRRLVERYLSFLAGLQDPERITEDARPQLGPHALLAWGQDFQAVGSTPQLALLVECSDGAAVRGRTRKMVDGLLDFARIMEPEAADAVPSVVTSRHLGTTIHSVPLAGYAEESQLAFLATVRGASPSWTVWNGWLILATSRDHLERILDAQYGLIPGLASVPDVHGLRLSSVDRSTVSILQPDLAARVLEAWLTAHEAGKRSPLDAALWGAGGQHPADRDSPVAGIELTEEPAVVVVEKVDVRSTAYGKLAAGDRIIGIDGRLLAAANARSDLERRWLSGSSRPGPTLRVQRAGGVVDVVVPRAAPQGSGGRIDPVGAVRELAAVARALEFGSYAEDVSSADHFSARISLRFRAARVSEASAE